jgi:hypothetical protein
MAAQTPVTDLVRYVLSDTLVSSSVFVRIKYIKEDKKNSVEHSNFFLECGLLSTKMNKKVIIVKWIFNI